MEPFLGLSARCTGLSAPMCEDIELVDRLLGEVLEEQEGDHLLRIARQLYHESETEDPLVLMERIPELKEPHFVHRLLRAYTVLFQLLNTVEQKEIVRVNRERQTQATAVPRPESIREAVWRLKQSGVTAEQMQQLLYQLDICPTITAHPTEARRRSVLDKLYRMAQLLADRALPPGAPRLDTPLNTVGMAEGELRRTLTALWQTDEFGSTAVTPQDEVRNALYFLQHTILDVVAWLVDDLRSALKQAYPGTVFEIPPFIRYRSWVGGDRDGNPNVTPEVTWWTLLMHKKIGLQHYLRRVYDLRHELTQSVRLVPASEELLLSLEEDKEHIALPAHILRRHAREPYALKLCFIAVRLKAALKHLDALTDFHAEGPSFVAHFPAYQNSQELLADLLLLQRSLRENRAGVLADEGSLANLIAQVRAFGFHLATLDIRQHSDEHAKAVDEILEAAQVLPPGVRYTDLPEEEKVRLLTRELCSTRPLLPREWEGTPHTLSVLQVFEVIKHALRYISRESVRAYVISMTHGISDVLEVLLLAKEAGLVRWRDGQMESDLDVVPLFETIHDLQTCHTLMRELFANRAYRHHLQARGNFQEIMLGYSDSSKDGGYLAANWSLHETQARLTQTCRKAGVDFRLFHGRGGTIGRGGGRANQAILSQPPGSMNGRIRFTEQGEVVSFRYGLAPIAHRHLEQIANAVLLATAGHTRRRIPRRWQEAMEQLAQHSLQVYRALVYEEPDFWAFYTQATPISHISRLPIASRPVFRPRDDIVGLENLRAIPWVFAWVQSRYVIPGWYGVGSALEWFGSQSAQNLALLREMYRQWSFFRMVIDNAQLELVRAHLPTARLYASRVQPHELGERLHTLIEQEYQRTVQWVLRITEQDELMQNARVIQRTAQLRNPAVMPLSKLQLALLDLWDKHAQREPQSAWHDAILLSIAGIAAAMQSTG
ncbi:MAG: phosphoenolpyruvate carboxylase [Armatimonadota bacterium]|nr:phosphoenolpyruvate carboxylase [bacterium]MDW8321242.1 phosphoenolpyruvate carboxylase [Armatimonadota bacterium]